MFCKTFYKKFNCFLLASAILIFTLTSCFATGIESNDEMQSLSLDDKFDNATPLSTSSDKLSDTELHDYSDSSDSGTSSSTSSDDSDSDSSDSETSSSTSSDKLITGSNTELHDDSDSDSDNAAAQQIIPYLYLAISHSSSLENLSTPNPAKERTRARSSSFNASPHAVPEEAPQPDFLSPSSFIETFPTFAQKSNPSQPPQSQTPRQLIAPMQLPPPKRTSGQRPTRHFNISQLAAHTTTPMIYQQNNELISKHISQSTSESHLNKDHVYLSVEAPTSIATTPGHFSIIVFLENRTATPAENLNISLALEGNSVLSLIPPVPEVKNFTLRNVYRLSYNLSIARVKVDQRVSFAVHVTQLVHDQDPPSSRECLVTTYSQQISLPKSPVKKAIIVVPGICGSELFSAKAQQIEGKQYSKGYRVYPPEGAIPFTEDSVKSLPKNIFNTDPIRLAADFGQVFPDKDGNSRADIMAACPFDCRNSGCRTYGIANVYKLLVFSLLKSPYTQGYDIIFFSYDWRRSNSEIAVELEKYIKENDYTNTVLLAHSMGGLVCASYLMKGANRLRTDKLITLGTPFLGAPKALSVLLDGKFFDGIGALLSSSIVNPMIKELVKNLPSVYELLPSQHFFYYARQGYLKRFGQRCIFLKKEEASIDSYEETCDTIKSLGLAPNADVFLSKAATFHADMCSSGHQICAIDGVQVYCIAGIGLKTLVGQRLKFQHGEFKKIDGTIYGDGDGTVPTISAIAGGPSDANLYYVPNVNHMGLISNPYILELLINILQNEPEKFNPIKIHTSPNSSAEGGCSLSCRSFG
ncbi:MAG: hypothetical protein LBJ95_04620 [Oscillospiraceae bacterium]|jgi:pimeloyl-ACP methyl ester carboxylesterase|nr:hypothetical protein [Oscillospiraceae bacterium]